MSNALNAMQAFQAGLGVSMNSVPGRGIPKFPGTNVPLQFVEPAARASEMGLPTPPPTLPSVDEPSDQPLAHNASVKACTKCSKFFALSNFRSRSGKVRKTCQHCADAHNASNKRHRLKAAHSKRRDSQVSISVADSIVISDAGTNALPKLLLDPNALFSPRFKPRVESLTTMSGTELSSTNWGEAEDRHLDNLGDDFVDKLEGKILRAMSMNGESIPASFLAQPHQSVSLADVFRSVNPGSVDLLRHENSPPAVNTPTARLEAAIIRLALVTRLQEMTWRYHWLRHKSQDSRKDFFRETSLLYKQFQEGNLQPWAPVTTWLQWYATQESLYWTGRTIHDATDSYTGVRMLVGDLSFKETWEWQTALDEVKLLCGVLSVPNLEEELESCLQWMKAEVIADCNRRGCLMLGEILTEGMIKKARFSKLWVMDTEDRRKYTEE
jgi:hypothetical protein